MLKIGSDEWVNAELQNRAIRDTNRKIFWEEYGTPTHDMSAIDIPIEERLANIQQLYTVSGSKLNDDALEAMKAYVLPILLQFSVGNIERPVNFFGNLFSHSPTLLKDFFVIDFIPTYDFTKVEK